MSMQPRITFPSQRKNPRTYTVPCKVDPHSWYPPPYVPHSYKLLVPLINTGQRLPFSAEGHIQFENRLNARGLVKLPEDICVFLQLRGMQYEIQVWRERLTQLRNSLKRVDFPEAGGYIILDIGAYVPQDPQHLLYDPKPLAEILENFFGPIQKHQLTAGILMFFQKRELDQDTRVFDEWETLFWPAPSALLATVPTYMATALAPLPIAPAQLAAPPAPLPAAPASLAATPAPPAVPSAPLPAPRPPLAAAPAAAPPVPLPSAPAPLVAPPAPLPAAPAHLAAPPVPLPAALAPPGAAPATPATAPVPDPVAPTAPLGTSHPNLTRQRGMKSTPVTPVTPIPGFQLVSGTKSAQVRRTLHRLHSGFIPTPTSKFPRASSTPVSGSGYRAFVPNQLRPASPPGWTAGNAHEGLGVIDRGWRGRRANSTKYDDRKLIFPSSNVYPNLQRFERCLQRRVVTPFILIITIYNSLLICGWAWEWRYGAYEAQVAEARSGQSDPAPNLENTLWLQSGKLQEKRNSRELDEDWPPLSSYERERQMELEWDKMGYLLQQKKKKKRYPAEDR